LTCGELREAVESLFGQIGLEGSKHLSGHTFALFAFAVKGSGAIPHFGGKLPVFRLK
jgi:hypothetical protein